MIQTRRFGNSAFDVRCWAFDVSAKPNPEPALRLLFQFFS